MPAPQPARNPLADNCCLQERLDLISKKYSGGLNPQETARLAEIEDHLDRQDFEKAELIETRSRERMQRVDAMLDKVEQAIQNLQASKPQ